MWRRGVFEIGHVNCRRAIQCVKSHVQRMPWPGELQARIAQRMGIRGYGCLVIQPPAPVALSIEKVINHALDDLPKCPKLPAYRILKLVVPTRPRILLSSGRRGLKEH